MKTVVITGSTRGLGLEMAKQFRRRGYNVVINGMNTDRAENAVSVLKKVQGQGKTECCISDVSDPAGIRKLLDFAVSCLGNVDIWINNAGINQPMKALWELTEDEIDAILKVDLRGAVMGTRAATLHMMSQPNGGMIYNLEGFGSNNAMMLGLNMYGTSKHAVTFFTRAFAKELEERGSKVKIGRLSPGMMHTDFTTRALDGKEEIPLSEKTQKVYSILGDQPDVVAAWMVGKIIANRKNDAHFEWLTGRKAAWRFLKSSVADAVSSRKPKKLRS